MPYQGNRGTDSSRPGAPGASNYACPPPASASGYLPAILRSHPHPPAGNSLPIHQPRPNLYPDIDWTSGASGMPASASVNPRPMYSATCPIQGGFPGSGVSPHPHPSAPHVPLSHTSALTPNRFSQYHVPAAQGPSVHPVPSAPPPPISSIATAPPYSPVERFGSNACSGGGVYAPDRVTWHHGPGHENPSWQHIPSHVPPMHASPHGRKKALLIGCNYLGTDVELKGCYADVNNMEHLLRSRFGYRDITILRDDSVEHDKMPTRANILRQMAALVSGAQAGDSLLFHFSGHGSQDRDPLGDEKDGMNETICPSDFRTAGEIIDDVLNKYLVNPLPPGVVLHALVDACHSGTVMDLRHITKLHRRSQAMRWNDEGPTRVFKGTRGGLVVQFSACKDSETAADTEKLSGGIHTGAATYLFIEAVERLIKKQQPLTYSVIMKAMLYQVEEFNNKQGSASGMQAAAMAELTERQTPQLSASEPFDLDMPLIL